MKRLILILVLPLVLFAGLSDSLSNVWNFNGYSLKDSVGDAHMNNDGATGTTGIHDECYSFDGNDEMYSFSGGLEGWGVFTINAWFDKGSHVDWHSRFSTGTYDFRWEDGGTDTTVYVQDANLFTNQYQVAWNDSRLSTDSGWVMLTMTVDGDSGRFYINGELHRTIIQTGTSANGGGRFNIGCRSQNTSYDWNGKCDEVYIWENRSLTDSEISQLYNSGDGLFYPFETETEPIYLGDSLVVYWNFNNSSLLDTVTYDRYNAIYDFDKYGNYYHQLGVVDSCWLFNFGNFRQKKVSISGDSTVSINFWSKKNAYYQYRSRMSFGVGNFDMRDFQDSIIYVYDGDLFSSSKALIEDNRLRADSGWVMITMTTDGDSVRSYVNGELNKTIKQDGVIATTTPAPEIIFGGGTYTTRQWSGYIDEFGVWEKKLNQNEIDSLFLDTLVFSDFKFSETDTFLIDWNGIDLDLIDTWNGIDLDLIQSINGIDLK